jgi:DNA-binding beta-propeller fold protein YncE
MYSRNRTNGQLAPLSPATIATENTPTGITISPDGNYTYVTNFNSDTISIYFIK